QVCPICRDNLSESQLFKSPDTENLVQSWMKIRQTLLRGALEEKIKSSQKESDTANINSQSDKET
ncbi:9657_t:CDS:2, partial [Acaulospora morrowiae]